MSELTPRGTLAQVLRREGVRVTYIEAPGAGPDVSHVRVGELSPPYRRKKETVTVFLSRDTSARLLAGLLSDIEDTTWEVDDIVESATVALHLVQE